MIVSSQSILGFMRIPILFMLYYDHFGNNKYYCDCFDDDDDEYDKGQIDVDNGSFQSK